MVELNNLKLEKIFLRIVNEFADGSDPYVVIETITYDYEFKSVTIIGRYGYYKKYDVYNESFKLDAPMSKLDDFKFLTGMFYQIVLQNWQKTEAQ